MTDQEKLIRKAKEGNNAALEELLISVQGKVYNLCCRFTGITSEAEDLSQEILIKVVSSLRFFKGDSAFSTWVYRIAVNTLKDNRRRKRIQTLPLEKKNKDGKEYLPYKDSGDGPLAVIERKETIGLLLNALSSLPEKQRLVVILRDIQGLSYKEAADVLNVEEGTVKSRLSRGRHRLREILSAGNFFNG